MYVRLRPYLICVFVLASAGLAPAPQSARATASAPRTQPNVIMIVVDTLRAGRLSAYGHYRPTTPNLQALVADQGVLFADVTSSASWTFPANGALVTGFSPTRLGLSWDAFTHTLPLASETLAEKLHDAGYYTAGFITNIYVSHYVGFAQGFDVYDENAMHSGTSAPVAGMLTDEVITWTQQYTGQGPVFLYVYYFDPHTWYNPPEPYNNYDPTYTGTITPAVYADGWDVIHGLVTLTPRDIEHLFALYDGEITYTDAQIGRLFAALDARGFMDNALVVVTSDHGDMLGEHDKWVHGNSVYEELVRVPLMMRYTGAITPGLTVTTPVQSMDLMPTVLDYTGIAPPPGQQAASLRPLIEGQVPSETRPVFSEVNAFNNPAGWQYAYAPRVDLRSMREERWKYIHHVSDPASDELYYLQPDSLYETDNVISLEPERAARMLQALKNWFGLNRAHLPAFFFLP